MYLIMIKSTNSFSKYIVFLSIAVSVSACGSKRVAPAEAIVSNTKDITRPPIVDKSEAAADAEIKPGETVSYDEWRRRREAEKSEAIAPPK